MMGTADPLPILRLFVMRFYLAPVLLEFAAYIFFAMDDFFYGVEDVGWAKAEPCPSNGLSFASNEVLLKR